MRNKESLSSRLTKEIAESKRMRPADSGTIPERGDPKGVGGWLLFFCVSLTILSPGILIYQMTTSIIKYQRIWSDNKVFQLVNIALVVYGMIIGMLLWGKRKGSVKQTKIFLLVNALVLCALAIVGIVFGKDQPIGIVADSFEIIYLILWLLYFSNSRRVANTFRGEKDESQPARNTES